MQNHHKRTACLHTTSARDTACSPDTPTYETVVYLLDDLFLHSIDIIMTQRLHIGQARVYYQGRPMSRTMMKCILWLKPI